MAIFSISYDYTIYHDYGELLPPGVIEFAIHRLEDAYRSSRTTLDRHRYAMAIGAVKKLARDNGLTDPTAN